MPDAAAPLLEVRDLRVGFRTERGLLRAVDGVSFQVHAREVLGVVGESGSGKSMSLLSVLGLVNDPNAVIEGSVRFQGQELVGLPPTAFRRIRGRAIAMIFQDPMTAMTPVYSVGWQIAEQLRTHLKLSGRAARARSVELLAEVGIPDPASVFDRFPHQLSGGMRQRCMIAMAVSCNPALLIADEPTTALDVTVQAQILDLLRRLQQDHGTAIVLVTHDLGVVAEMADRVIVMYGGRVAEEAPVDALFSDAWHPYTWGLMGSVARLDGPRPHRLPSIPGAPPALRDIPRGCAFAPRCPHRFAACAERPPLAGGGGHSAACFLPAAARPAARRGSLQSAA